LSLKNEPNKGARQILTTLRAAQIEGLNPSFVKARDGAHRVLHQRIAYRLRSTMRERVSLPLYCIQMLSDRGVTKSVKVITIGRAEEDSVQSVKARANGIVSAQKVCRD